MFFVMRKALMKRAFRMTHHNDDALSSDVSRCLAPAHLPAASSL